MTKIAKIRKFTKTANLTLFCKTIDKINNIYSLGCKEGLTQVTKIVKITKFSKTAKFTVFCKTNNKIYDIYSLGCKESPSKVTKIAKITKLTETTKMYCNSQDHWQNLRNLLKGLQGRLLQSDKNCKNYKNWRKLPNLLKFARPPTNSMKFIQRVATKGLFKVTRIAKITKFTITAKFTIIRLSIHEMHKSLWKGYMEVPNAIYENYEFYEIS